MSEEREQIIFETMRQCNVCRLVGRYNIKVDGRITFYGEHTSETEYVCLYGHRLTLKQLIQCKVYSISRLNLE